MSSAADGALDPGAWIRGPVADLFSSYVAAAALSAAHELGLLDQLAATGEAPLEADGDGSRLDPQVLRALYTALHWAEVVRIKDDQIVIPGPRFEQAYAMRGYFYWLVRGCGEVFTNAPHLAWEDNRTGSFYQRDMRAVAVGSRLIGDSEVEPLFDALLAELPPKKIVDLGCGSGQRLIRIATRHPGVQCIGVDISEDAVRLASETVAGLGLADRVLIHRADVRTLEPEPAYSDVDTVTCVFMGHDFWPRKNCVRTLRRLRAAFPRAERLLLCDVTRTTEPPGPDATIFTLGFELVHALMAVPLPTFTDWQQAFADSGWACEAIRPVTEPPNGFLFELTPRPHDTEAVNAGLDSPLAVVSVPGQVPHKHTVI